MSKSCKSNSSSNGIGVAGLLGVAFIVLKLTGYITWKWIWVLFPFWISIALTIIILIIFFLFTWND